MTNQSDSFIDEVTADLRRDRLFRVMKRYGWIVVLLILGIVGGSAYYEYTRIENNRQAQAFGDAVLAADAAPDRAAALAAVDAGDDRNRQLVAGLLTAGALAEQGQGAAAAEDLRALARNVQSGDALMHDLAMLKAVIAGGTDMNPADRDGLLTELSRPGAPFELLALEQKAVALIGAGRDDDAIMLIRQIQQKDGLSEPLRRRLAEMMIVMGAEPEPEAVAAGAPAAAAN
ncbi:hypothetical protein PE067_17460 [Paracoccus sp. DMF-8]|uniref:tetratricopeptide repeat protein n=1 Tax=Paracoccus sp. DMF-8 TaxID=3019445 RepID=UPI0023E454D0|nr:tetratricopeptide repeat protein [Paracoccus sp. DMF-8]MDF3607770.1 hypothetical protein [Paracoccus sp. DMF-8]